MVLLCSTISAVFRTQLHLQDVGARNPVLVSGLHLSLLEI